MKRMVGMSDFDTLFQIFAIACSTWVIRRCGR
jgi:hypothetical protein